MIWFPPMARCLWPKVGLRDGPGRGKELKYLATITFGEVVKLTGNTREVEGRNYLEMRLSDGETGWAYEYLFAVGAERAVAILKVDIFKRPDITTLTTKKLTRGMVFGIETTEKAGWYKVYSKKKAVEGWARLSQDAYSTEEVDVALMIKIDQIKELSNNSQKRKELETLTSSSIFSSSPLISMAEDMLLNMEAAPTLRSDQLVIKANVLNVRSEPRKPGPDEADNVVFQVKDGNICKVLEIGEEKVSIRELNDYWYKIEYDGQVGWVYGHYTSRAL